MIVKTKSMQGTIDSIVNRCLEKEGLTWEAFAKPGPVDARHIRAWDKMKSTSFLISIELMVAYKDITRWRISYINRKKL